VHSRSSHLSHELIEESGTAVGKDAIHEAINPVLQIRILGPIGIGSNGTSWSTIGGEGSLVVWRVRINDGHAAMMVSIVSQT
jgi:hypothetical protein